MAIYLQDSLGELRKGYTRTTSTNQEPVVVVVHFEGDYVEEEVAS
jgi:hypothetical protein